MSSKLFRRAVAPRFGRYSVLGELGSGGMGTVREAYDDELGRRVALKLLRPEYAELKRPEHVERHRARLRREAQALAKLSHPNVVQVFEVGEIDGQPFVALELVPGPTLRTWQTRTPRPGWRRCVEVYLGAGRGLAAAHAVGLVHRDFKPDNCIVDQSERARVLDFGLVMQEETAPTERDPGADDSGVTLRDDALGASLTDTGTTMGTPGYMPLEQFEGRVADSLSDQFAFCVSLYEAVYGKRPFGGRTAIEIGEAMREGNVRPPPRGTKVPRRLRAILLRGLATEPRRRWPSMNVLLRKLEGLLAPRWSRSRVFGLAGVGVGLSALVVLGKVWASPKPCANDEALDGIWGDTQRIEVARALQGTSHAYAADTWAQVEPELDDYAQAWQVKERQVCEATRVQQLQSEADMDLRMQCMTSRKLELRATVEALTRTNDHTLERANELLSALSPLEDCDDLEILSAEMAPPRDPEVARMVAAEREQLILARVHRLAGEPKQALELTSQVAARTKALSYGPLRAEALLELGEVEDDLGDYDDAERDLEQAHLVALENDHLEVQGRATRALAWVMGYQKGDHEEGHLWAKMALALSRGRKAKPSLEAEALGTLGILLRSQGRLDESVDTLAQALDLQEATLGHQHPALAATTLELGNAMMQRGEFELAHRHYMRAVTIQQQNLGPLHPEVARTIGALGNLMMARGEPDSALRYYREAFDIQRQSLTADHEELGMTLGNIGYVLGEQGEFELALAAHRQSLDILERALEPNHDKLSMAQGNIARGLEHLGRLDDALEGYQRAKQGFETAHGPDHPLVAQTLDNMGVVLEKQGRLDDALAHHQQAQEIFEATLGPEHPLVANVMSNIGDVLRKQGKHAKASAAYENALEIAEASEAPTSVISPRLGLARLAAKRGDSSAAREHAARIDQLAKAGINVDPEVLDEVLDMLKTTDNPLPSTSTSID